ncbi:MAG: DUF423 domain-containing protein [Bdellovibrionia bacterium]
MSKQWLMIGTLSGFFGVVLGAFGAHALKASLDEKALAVYHTAVQYHMIHALALIGLGLWAGQNPLVNTQVAGWGFTLGIMVFSGSLYVLAITQLKFLGAITPIGGVSFLVGWIAFAFLVWKA